MKIDTATTYLCPMCENGEMIPQRLDFGTSVEGETIIVPDVDVEVCSGCKEMVLTPAGSRRVSEYIEKMTGAISNEEIQTFLAKYRLTHKKAANILGIGEKNLSRWLNGKQRVSSSMSNYIRTLVAHPEAFETLSKRQWDHPTSEKQFPTEERQPNELEKAILTDLDYSTLARIGIVEKASKRDEKRTNICRFFQCTDLVELQASCANIPSKIAAFKDTKQKFSVINGGIWIQLAEKAATNLHVSPYSQDKLEDALDEIRELTEHEPHDVFPAVQKRLAAAGVAVVVIPLLKGSAFRGCTRLLHPGKAMIAHSLKYKNVSQFWRVLFHEIAHLILHINSPEDRFDEYESKVENRQEQEADQWADEFLVYRDKLLAFETRHMRNKPTIYDLQNFARQLKTSTAIVADVINEKMKKEKKPEVFNYGHLRKVGMFPTISEEEAKQMWAASRELILSETI
ncbi:MAG: type II toxin-antitoxin system MqsA family antitoxin [Verrucomicrobiales bacterium]|nr:type II toxin-antitoxin system MqsA family antitoxin [Verrucomicrobiales bacterium]